MGHTTIMKCLVAILLLSCTTHLDAATYYVTPAGAGDESGGSDANPMSYRALFQKPLDAGDRVYFKAGEVYAAQHWAKSGVTYGRYGEGANPVLSGATALTEWTPSESGGIY